MRRSRVSSVINGRGDGVEKVDWSSENSRLMRFNIDTGISATMFHRKQTRGAIMNAPLSVSLLLDPGNFVHRKVNTRIILIQVHQVFITLHAFRQSFKDPLARYLIERVGHIPYEP